MRLLFDTHAFLSWMGRDTTRLSARTFDCILDPGNTVFFSVINAWEIAIKTSRKKLQSPSDIEGAVRHYEFTVLPVTLSHVLEFRELPLHHKDPFDRMLVAQARAEQLTLITADLNIRKYDVSVLDA